MELSSASPWLQSLCPRGSRPRALLFTNHIGPNIITQLRKHDRQPGTSFGALPAHPGAAAPRRPGLQRPPDVQGGSAAFLRAAPAEGVHRPAASELCHNNHYHPSYTHRKQHGSCFYQPYLDHHPLATERGGVAAGAHLPPQAAARQQGRRQWVCGERGVRSAAVEAACLP